MSPDCNSNNEIKMPLTDDDIARLLVKYLREQLTYRKMAAEVQSILQAVLQSHHIRCVVTSRAKDRESLQGKLRDQRDQHDYEDLRTEFNPSLIDIAGARVMLYEFGRDNDRTVRIIEETFNVPEGDRFRKDPGLGTSRVYQARHRVVCLRPAHLRDNDQLVGVLCEIQIVSLVKHVWNELEHDIEYKDPEGLGKPDVQQKAWLEVLWDSMQAVETGVSHLSRVTDIRRAKRAKMDGGGTPIESSEELRLALGHILERFVTGDVGVLYRLLRGSQKEFTPDILKDELTKNKAASAVLEDGTVLAENVGVKDPDVVEILVAHLSYEWGADFKDLLGSQGPETRIRQLIEALGKSRSEVTQ